MIAAQHRYSFRPEKKGIKTLPPRVRVRNLTFVEAATDLTVPPAIFDTVLLRLAYARRYDATRCVESIRIRLYELAYRAELKTPGTAACLAKKRCVFERQFIGRYDSVSLVNSLPTDHWLTERVDGFIRTTLLAHPKLGFTADIIDEALARSVPHRIAPPRRREFQGVAISERWGELYELYKSFRRILNSQWRTIADYERARGWSVGAIGAAFSAPSKHPSIINQIQAFVQVGSK